MSKHQQTLEDVFADPVKSNIRWSDVESLLVSLRAEITEGRGSRVRVALNGEVDPNYWTTGERFLDRRGRSL